MRPDSLLRLWCCINHLLTYLLIVAVMWKNSGEDYTPVSRSPRGRGRGSGQGSAATPGHKERVTVEDSQLQSDDDIVTINSVKLGKRFR